MIGLKKSISVLIVLAILVPSVTTAEMNYVGWAGSVFPGAVPPVNPDNALGAPDANQTSFTLIGAEATYSSFPTFGLFPVDGLADFLGVSEAQVAQAEFMAFEGNQINGIGFEASTWVFSGGGVTEVFHIPDGVFHSGIVSHASYSAYFGVDAPTWSEWPYILVDLHVVDPGASEFSVTIQGEGTTTGSPDPDAMGVISARPVPNQSSTWGAVKSLFWSSK